MVFLVRVRDPSGMHRLVFSSESTATWRDLQQQIADVCRLPIDRQLISRTPLHAPQYIEATGATGLKALKIANGDVLYLGGHTAETIAAKAAQTPTPAAAASSSSSSSASSASAAGSSAAAAASAAPTHQLTSRCQHGPRGACPYCLGVEPGQESKVRGRCNHPAGATCLHCSSAVKAQSTELATWLCTHPESVFCPKCIPPETEEEKQNKQQRKCDCDRAKGQECSRCLVTKPSIKVDKIPFARYLDEKRAMCKFKHGPTMTCAMCVPPTLPSFVGKKVCDKGHQPWPAGVCLSCAPPNATIREQSYRHCDSISVFPSVLQPFYTQWMRSGSSFQRAAILLGRYMDEPEETNNPGAIRAVVHALYEPPQENARNFVRFLKDPNEKLIHSLSQQLGLEVVGWVVTTPERKGDKYAGHVIMSGLEVQQAARFQNRYKDQFGYSKFVTVVMEHADQVEPRAYQVSDLAVCLERDGVLAKAADSNMICTRVPGAGEMCPTVIFKDRPLLPGKEFLPDEFIVKVITLQPKSVSEWQFAHAEFPALKDQPTDGMVGGWMRKYAKEGYLQRLADFNLLSFLAAKGTIPEKALNDVCQALKNKAPLAKETTAALDALAVSKGWV